MGLAGRKNKEEEEEENDDDENKNENKREREGHARAQPASCQSVRHGGSRESGTYRKKRKNTDKEEEVKL